MPKTRQQKEQAYTELVDKIKNRKAMAVADFSGLTVAATQELRGKCRDEKIEVMAVKKTLLKKALQASGLQIDDLNFTGSLVAAFSDTDEVAPARVLYDFAKTHEQVRLQSGILEGAMVGEDKVNFLAQLPSKKELYGKIVGSLNAPISGLVNVCAGTLRSFLYVINAIKETK